MDDKHSAANCRWAKPTLFLPPPLWLKAWDCSWTCTRDENPNVLETTEACADCPRWEQRETERAIEVKPMRVQDTMTREVVSCHTDTDIGAAARLMLEGGFGTVPVVDAHGKLVGIITDRDIAMAAATRQRNASHIAVHEAMCPRVRSCFAHDDLDAALKQMEEARVRRLPVLDANEQLVGILSIDDIILRALDQENGVASSTFIEALRRICSRPGIEPEVNFSDTFVSG